MFNVTRLLDVNRLRRSPFAFPLAAMAALAMLLISETTYRTSRDSMDTVYDLSVARLRMQRVLRLMVDAESAERGYLITGRSEYMEPYLNAIEGLPETMAKLKQHFKARPERLQALAQLEDTMGKKLSELATTIRMYDEGRTDAWRELIMSNIGKDQKIGRAHV